MSDKKPEMKDKKYVYKIEDLPMTNLTPESATRFILTENALVSFIENPPGTEFPLHSHDAEQVLIILEGSEEHQIDGQIIHMEAGDVCVHPPNVVHGGITKTGFKGVDIFCPPRTDHVELMRKQGLLKEE
jgi:quercetin dioxygenase-like cupin family protein